MRSLNAQIRLGNLCQNYRPPKELYGNKLLAVVKADAYGHGAVRCAHALADIADGFAAAMVDGGVELRQNGIKDPVVLLEGVFGATEYAGVDRYDSWPAIDSQWQLEAFTHHEWQRSTTIQLKMDPGMYRAGFFPHNYAVAYTALKQFESVESIVEFSHFACAGEPENGMTKMQFEVFDSACEGLEGEESLANSAAILSVPEARRDWGRAGLALYGVSPFGGVDERLKPVMRLISRVFGEHVLQPHSPIGYDAMFYTSKSIRVGLIACDYADGYPCRASISPPVAIDGKRSHIIGRVSMDTITVEPEASKEGLGAEVEFWDDMTDTNEVAEVAGTIPCEILYNTKCAKFTYIEQAVKNQAA